MTIIDRLYQCIDAQGLEGLTEAERSLFALYWHGLETNNGGVHQFFFNDSGKLAGQALQGLRMVGADQTAEILQRAIACFPEGHVPADLTERRTLMDALDGDDDALMDRMGALTSELYRCKEDVAELLDAYRVSHPDEFPCLKKQ